MRGCALSSDEEPLHNEGRVSECGGETGGAGEDETFTGIRAYFSGVVESLSKEESSDDDIMAKVGGVAEGGSEGDSEGALRREGHA